jgi:hypothetical protein
MNIRKNSVVLCVIMNLISQSDTKGAPSHTEKEKGHHSVE